MAFYFILWNDEPGENVDKILQHGLTVDDVEFVLNNPEGHGTSRSSNRPFVVGTTPDGDYIMVIYDWIDDDTINPVTAYDIDED